MPIFKGGTRAGENVTGSRLIHSTEDCRCTLVAVCRLLFRLKARRIEKSNIMPQLLLRTIAKIKEVVVVQCRAVTFLLRRRNAFTVM